ncbi:4-phosphoerythronate dehydrogenase PdxB [Halopseudomonas salegens]|uniref:Erythronate-4-phosphate dehydrogenase n=1 Tax=Halopseudomonas salegens TaxID=1434072 RepID=A0A1H2F2Z8_9GAMM|nr:4-phosphoerythronate dehydrogenase PdxB [Halopseudomonas salegens]SDU01699.1 4-phosphoerythronate dehydrogenase [Halopseudomonas salegens]
MRILADENIPLLDAFFADQGSITRLPGRAIDAAAMASADALLLRSVTRVTADMLQDSPVRFIGTCTIGTDHLDLPGLAAAGVHVASAPGCNARGVVEYVLSALLTLSERTGLDWRQRCVGIVGVGEVGGRLAATLRNLGLRVLCCDPPRKEQGAADMVSLETLLAEADIISCHVPLTRQGSHATWHLFNQARLQALRPGTWLINSSRGPVVDNSALNAVLTERNDVHVVLDVWEHEPALEPQLVSRCALATPHIAGYSLDGKLRGTEMIYQAWCSFNGQPVQRQLSEFAPTAGCNYLQLDPGAPADWQLSHALRWVYDVRDDDARLRAMLARTADQAAIHSGFDRLRKDYPLRRETPCVRISGVERTSAVLLKAAGFSVLGQ